MGAPRVARIPRDQEVRPRALAGGRLDHVFEVSKSHRQCAMEVRACQRHHVHELQQVVHRRRRRAAVTRPLDDVVHGRDGMP